VPTPRHEVPSHRLSRPVVPAFGLRLRHLVHRYLPSPWAQGLCSELRRRAASEGRAAGGGFTCRPSGTGRACTTRRIAAIRSLMATAVSHFSLQQAAVCSRSGSKAAACFANRSAEALARKAVAMWSALAISSLVGWALTFVAVTTLPARPSERRRPPIVSQRSWCRRCLGMPLPSVSRRRPD